MTILIEGCVLDGVEPILAIDGRAAICASCREVVYPELHILRNHDICNYGTFSTWFSRDMNVMVHGCGTELAVEDGATFHAFTEEHAPR